MKKMFRIEGILEATDGACKEVLLMDGVDVKKVDKLLKVFEANTFLGVSGQESYYANNDGSTIIRIVVIPH